MMKFSAFVLTILMASAGWAVPAQTRAITLKPMQKIQNVKTKKPIKHPILLRVKRVRTQAQSKVSMTAKQFDLSGALRSAK